MTKKGQHPPKWIDDLLEIFIKGRFVDETIGDLHEWFYWKSETFTPLKLLMVYCWNVFRAFRYYKLTGLKELLILITNTTMLNNNIKLGLRSLIQNKFFTLINITGLTISITAFIFIFAYVKFELSYDDFHPQKDKIYRVLMKDMESGELIRPTSTPIANVFLSRYPDAIKFARFGQDPVFIEVNQSKFYQEDFFWADSTVFTFFHLPFLYGNPNSALTEPNTLVLTKQISEDYFGIGVNPVGKTIPVKIYDGNAEMLMRIDGVLEEIPLNSDLPFKVLGSMSNALELYSWGNTSWGFSWLNTYAMISSGADKSRIEAAIPQIILEAAGDQVSEKRQIAFQPLSEVHLHSSAILKASETGDINQIIIFIFIGILILVIATINYLNLIGARINKRMTQISIRKVLGANKFQLFGQFLTESNLTIMIGLVFSILFTLLLWPLFNGFTGKNIDFFQLMDTGSIAFIFLIVLICGSIAGLYPGFLIMSLKDSSFTGNQSRSARKNLLQKILVSFQFAISVFLIISTFVIYGQMKYMTDKDLGFNNEQLISIKVEDRELQHKIDLIKKEMAMVPGVKGATISGESLPSMMNNSWSLSWDENSVKEGHTIHLVSIDEDFFETLQIEVLEGTGFTNLYKGDSANFVLLNESAAKLIGNTDIIGSEISIGLSGKNVIGVVADYHYRSLQNAVEPTAFLMTKPGTRVSPDNILIKINNQNTRATVSALEKVWKEFSTEEYFNFHFVDQTFEDAYQNERQFMDLFTVFAFLSIVISCLGLYGIVLFTTEERTKEISVRKVLGSSVTQIILLISKRFILLISVGFLVGVPMAILFANDWLQQFTYRIQISSFNILAGMIVVIVISSLTIGLHTLKAAKGNPADYLRNE